jgi:acyl-CoA synthetase (NDP forming)
VPCLPALAAVPEPVDVVLLAVPDAALEEQLRAAARARARSSVIFGSAYDAAGTYGLRDRLAAVARDAGMALCGAGCMGFVNVARGLRAVGYVEADPLPAGPVALVTHPGRARRGSGFTLAADVPVVLLSVGASEAGQAMVAAHSGALAAAGGAWEALAAAYGVHRVGDLAGAPAASLRPTWTPSPPPPDPCPAWPSTSATPSRPSTSTPRSAVPTVPSPSTPS